MRHNAALRPRREYSRRGSGKGVITLAREEGAVSPCVSRLPPAIRGRSGRTGSEGGHAARDSGIDFSRRDRSVAMQAGWPRCAASSPKPSIATYLREGGSFFGRGAGE